MMKLKINNFKRFFIALIIFLSVFLFGLYMLIFHSPYTYIKDLWVTTAMSTLSHQYLAKMFVSDAEIAEILKRNRVVAASANVDPSLISEQTSSAIEQIDITGKGYKGKLLIVHDPSRVFVGAADTAKLKGKFIKDLVNKYDAVGGMNAGGFIDFDSKHGDGRGPDGLLISQGEVLNGENGIKYHLIGFTEDNKLVLGSYNLAKIKEMKVRDAVSFAPVLIVNGIPSKMYGNGGWGISPRTAIGQRKDGAVLMLVIDGRQISSIGASMKDLQDIMLQYGAYNATNLDGGSSTVMVYNGEIINSPSSVSSGRYLPDGFLIKKEN